MSQMIASLRGDTKSLALSSSSFLNNWKGQRKRSWWCQLVVWSFSHVSCVQTPLPPGKIGFFLRGGGVWREGKGLLGGLAVIGVMLLKHS